MGAQWHFSEPVLKIRAEIEVKGKANMVSLETITVLLKEVSDFSHEGTTSVELDNVSILNFCNPTL